MTDEKWRSPTRHSIASDVTDKLPPYTHPENVHAETPAPQGWKLVPIEPTEEMSLTFRREWQDMDIRGKLRSEMFKAAYKAMLSAAPKPAPTEKVDYKQLKQLVFRWAADVNGAPLDSDICEIINIIRRTEKVEGIDGLFDAVSVEDLPPPNTDEECDNITKRYQSHEAIYGCAVSETLLEAARAYLKLQTQED